MSGTGPDRDVVRDAIVELRSIRSADPCASITMTTIKATIHTLETQWLPTSGATDDPSHDGWGER